MKKKTELSKLRLIRRIYKNKKIGLAHGVFDLFHYGHLLHLKKAKEYCDILVVSITADKFVNKAPGRPYYNSEKRLEILSSLHFVDYVLVSNFDSAKEVLLELKPNFYFKGSEYANYSKDHTGKILLESRVVKKNNGKIIFTNEPILSSSNIINNFFSQISEETKNFIKKNKFNFPFDKIIEVSNKIKKQKILVIGDAIIDEYIFSLPLSKSPKEQIISVKETKKEIYNGGILATVNHISNFVDDVTLLTVMGESKSKNIKLLKRLNSNINKKIFYNKNLKTITKTRYLDNNLKKIFQKSNVDVYDLKPLFEKKILSYLAVNIKRFDQVIVNDFGHGLLTEKIIKLIEKKSKYLCVNAQTNSSNSGFNFITKYKKTFYISVDEPEARLATQQRFEKVEKLFSILTKKIKFSLCSITRGKKGTSIFVKKKYAHVPAVTDASIDTMGAGDAYFAISSLFAKFFIRNEILVGLLGNVAGALKIQYLGHREYLNKKKFFGYLKTLINI
jgi:cytidyltransferase-like protein